MYEEHTNCDVNIPGSQKQQTFNFRLDDANPLPKRAK